MNNYFRFLKNSYIQIIIILLIVVIILIIYYSKNNNRNFRSFESNVYKGFDVRELFENESTSASVTTSSTTIAPIPSVIKNDGQKFVPNFEIYEPLRNINMTDIVTNYFEYKFKKLLNDSSTINIGHNITFNNLNITLKDFINNYLSSIKSIKIPAYDKFLTNTFTSPEINTLLKLDDFDKTFNLYKNVLYVSYFYDQEIYDKIIKIQKNYYEIVFNKFQNNYEELGDFSINLYEYLHNNINDDKLFNNAIENSYNFVYNIYQNNINIQVPSLNSKDYNTNKTNPKMSYMEIFFELLDKSPTQDLPKFVNILKENYYADKIDQYNTNPEIDENNS
jgi:hypothetical protein